MVMAVGVLFLALYWTGHKSQDITRLSDFSAFSIYSMLIPASVCAAAIVFRLCCSRTYGGKLRFTRGVLLDSEDTRSMASLSRATLSSDSVSESEQNNSE